MLRGLAACRDAGSSCWKGGLRSARARNHDPQGAHMGQAPAGRQPNADSREAAAGQGVWPFHSHVWQWEHETAGVHLLTDGLQVVPC